ncbi:MAG: hypothetical protein ACTHLH_06950 [Solirubrobacterales bacterium]
MTGHRDNIEQIVRDAVEQAPPPRTPEEIRPRDREHFERMAAREGITLTEYLSRMVSAESFGAEDEAAEIARRARGRSY